MTEPISPLLNFTIVCDDVRQETGGKISLMGLFENIYATNFPAIHPRLAIMNEWSKGRGEYSIKTQILSPDRLAVIRETSSKMKLPDPNIRHRDISVHLNIEFATPGSYWIVNYLDNVMINSIPLNVIQLKEQPSH